MSDKNKFSEFLITELLGSKDTEGFIQRWENFVVSELEEVHYVELNLTLIRFFKGIIKSWRRWLALEKNK